MEQNHTVPTKNLLTIHGNSSILTTTKTLPSRYDKYGQKETRNEAHAKIEAMYKATNILGKFLTSKFRQNEESWLVTTIRDLHERKLIPLDPTDLYLNGQPRRLKRIRRFYRNSNMTMQK